MKKNWRAVGEIVAVTSVVFSLIFVGYELRLSRSIAQNEGFVTSAELAESVFSLQATHADVWQRGCLGEELSVQDGVIFLKVFRAVVDRRFASWARANIGITRGNPAFFAYGTALDRYRFPGFNEMWVNDISSRNIEFDYQTSLDGWGQAVEEFYLEFTDSNAEKNVGVAFCGL